MSNETTKFWINQINSTKSSNSIHNLSNTPQVLPLPQSKYTTASHSNITQVQQQRELRQKNLSVPYDQHSQTRRSLTYLPTASLHSSHTNNSICSTNTLRSSHTNHSSGYRIDTFKSLDDYIELDNRKSSKFNLENVNGYYSYENYVNERCSNKSRSPDYTITNADLEKFNRIRGEDLNIDNSKWLEEKPISVLQLDQPDRAVLKIADQRDKIQKKTFTKWINKYLTKQTVKINDLFEDLRDGVGLITLLSILSHKDIAKERGRTRFHSLQNVHRCLDFLEDHNIKLVNIRPDEIVDGNPKLTLGLIWIIILNFQISDIVGKDVIAKDALLSWANKHLQQMGLSVQDFTNSWRDGKAFLGILYRHIPNKFNWENIKLQSNKQNLQLAFNLAENEYNVTKLLDPEDVDVPTPDERSIITYVSSLYEGLPELKATNYLANSEKEKEKRGLLQEYSMLFKILSRWLQQSIDSMTSKSQLPSGYVELKSLIADLKCFRLEEYANKLRDKKKLQNVFVELQSYHGKKFSQVLRSEEQIGVINRLWETLDAAVQERENHLEQAILRSEKLQTKYESFSSSTEQLDLSLESLKSQLNKCLERFSDQNRAKKSVHTELCQQLAGIEAEIHLKEVEIRKALINAHKLQEENYPNSQVLIEGLKHSEQTTIGLLVTINTVKAQRPNQTLTTLVTTSTTNRHQTHQTATSESIVKSTTLISPPSSLSDPAYSSHLSTPSRSITTSSSSSTTDSNTQLRQKTSTHLKSTTHYFEINSTNVTPITIGSHPNISSPISEVYSPKSTSSFLSNISTNLSKSISLLNKSSQELTSITDTDIIDLINESFNWIRLKQSEIDLVKLKPDLSQIQLDLDMLFQLKNELVKSRTNLETIELLKMNHSESPELTSSVNQLNGEYHQLCASAKALKGHLDSLNEFIKLVHDELQYVNAMEDVELNRDWSQPGKLKYTDLVKHKKDVELSLSNKKMAYARIMTIADNLVESKHPASDDINAYVSALRTGKTWLLELMNLLGVHLSHLKHHDIFIKDYNELELDLNETAEKFNNLTNSTAYNLSTWNDSLREDFTNQFNQFKHSFQTELKFNEHFDRIYKSIQQIPSYSLRRVNLTKSPFNEANILTKYSQVDFTIGRGELCRIEDNADPMKWRILSLDKNRYADVPSVCFVLNGPDSEFVDLIDKLKFKYAQLDEAIKKFDATLKKDKVSKIMKEILNDSKSSKLQYISRKNIENLIQTVKEEVDQIISSQDQEDPDNLQPELSMLLNEFAHFNESINNQIVSSTNNKELSIEKSEEPIANVYFNVSNNKSAPDLFDLLNAKLERLYEQFRLIVNEQFVLHTQTANIHSIRKNMSLESKFQQFQHNEFKSFEKDLKYAEKTSSIANSSSNLSSTATNNLPSSSDGASSSSSINPNEDIKSKISNVKSKYQNLIHLSNLYSQSFSNLESLAKLVDGFIADMCKIEIKLAAQSLIENVDIDSELMNKEHESLMEVKALFKAHENDLMVMKSYYEELKHSMDKVRSRNIDQEKFSLLSVNGSRSKLTEDRQSEDLLKLDLLIKQLTDRWNHSLHFYRSRRSNLRDCQKAYEEYQSTLKVEKESLKKEQTHSNSIEQNQFLLNDKKLSVENCNQKAAQFVQLAKPKTKSNEVEAKLLYDNIRQILETLTEFEFVLARQNPLADSIDTLTKQTVDFEQFQALVTEKTPFFKDVIDKTKEFCLNPVNESSRLKSELTNFSDEAAYRLKTITAEIEKRGISLESATIHLTTLTTDQTKFHEWFDQAQTTFTTLTSDYTAASLHDLTGLQRFEKEAKTLEIILFSHQDDLPTMYQHCKTYTTSTENFSKDLKNFCVKLKNNKINRMSSDFASDLSMLRESVSQAEESYQTLSHSLDQFRAKLVKRIDANMLFENACMRLDLWLNEFEPKLNNEITKSTKLLTDTNNNEAIVRKLDDTHKRFQQFHSDIFNKRSDLEDISGLMKKTIDLIEPFNRSPNTTQTALEASYAKLTTRYQNLEQTSANQSQILLRKLTNMRNLKQNFDSTTQWLSELNHNYLNGSAARNNESNSPQTEDKLEIYDRIKADLAARKAMLLKNLESDPEAKEHLNQLLSKIDTISSDIESKALCHSRLQSSLSAFNNEYDRMNDYCQRQMTKLDAIDVMNGQFEMASKVKKTTPQIRDVQSCVKRVETMVTEAAEIERPKIQENLGSILTEVKYKFWPDVITDEKLKNLQRSIDQLDTNFLELLSQGQAKITDLQAVQDYSSKYEQLRANFEAYVQATETNILNFEPIGIHVNNIAAQGEQLEALTAEYENKSNDLTELTAFSNAYVSLSARINEQKHHNLIGSKLNSVSAKTRKHASSLNNSNSASSSCDNLSNSFENEECLSSSSSMVSMSGFEAEIGQELAKLGQVYEWIGERLDERKRDLSDALESMKEYLKHVDGAEMKLDEFTEDVRNLFGVRELGEKAELKLVLDLVGLEKLGNKSEIMVNDNRITASDVLNELKSKQCLLFERLAGDKTGVETLKSQLNNLSNKFDDHLTNHCNLNQTLTKLTDDFTTYLSQYSHLKSELTAKQTKLEQIINSNRSKTNIQIETETLENEIANLQSLINDQQANSLDELNQLGEALIRHTSDPSELKTQMKGINENFVLVADGLNDTLKFKSELVALSVRFNDGKEDLVTTLNQVDGRMKNLTDDCLMKASNEDEVKSVLNELDTIETVTLDECRHTLDEITNNYNEMRDLTCGHLKENANIELIILPDKQTPENLSARMTHTSISLKTLKDDFVCHLSQLNSNKAFDDLHIDLKDFIQFKTEQINNFNKLSTQVSKLRIEAKTHETFKRDLGQRGEDMTKLIEFYNTKISELEKADAEDVQIIARLKSEIDANWKELLVKSEARGKALTVCIAEAEKFDAEYERIKKFPDECENRKSNLMKPDQSLETLFTSRTQQIQDLLADIDGSLVTLKTLCTNLKSTCELDHDVIEGQFNYVAQRICNLTDDLEDSLKTTANAAEDLKEFNSNVEETTSHMTSLSTAITNANGRTATKALPMLEEIKSEITAEIPEKINACSELANKLTVYDTTGFTGTKVDQLRNEYKILDSTVDLRIKETSEKVSEINKFQEDLAKMDEKLTNIQDFLSKKEDNGAYVKGTVLEKPGVIDEESLKAKQANLDSVKDTLNALNDQLKTATDMLNKHLEKQTNDQIVPETESYSVITQLQQTVFSLNEKSLQLSSLQAIEEEAIKEQTEMLDSLTDKIVKCNEDVTKCGKDFDSVMLITSPLTTKASVSSLINEHECYEQTNLLPIRDNLKKINQESKELFNIDINKPSYELNLQPVDINQVASLNLKLEKLNGNFNRLDSKFKERAKQLDLALYKSSKFEDKYDLLNENLSKSEQKMECLSKTLFDFHNLSEIEEHLETCEELGKQLGEASDEIDEFKEICEKLMQNCESAEHRDIIEKHMDGVVYQWNIQLLALNEKKANLTFLNRHLNELNESYLSAGAFTSQLNLKFTSELALNCIEPIVIKSTQEKMRLANEDLVDKFDIINDLKVDTNNLLAVYEDFKQLNSAQESGELTVKVDNKLVKHLPKTISLPQLFNLVCMVNKPEIEANVHDIDFKYSDYKFQLGKNLDLMQRLHPLCEKFSQTIAQLNQSFGKLDSELDWLQTTNDNETSQKEKESLFAELQSSIAHNEQVIDDLQGPLTTRMVDELNTTNSQCDEFIEDLNETIAQVENKFHKTSENLANYAQAFELKKQKVREIFGEMDDLLEWLDDIDAKFNNLEPISHEPEVIKIQLNEQKNLNEEINTQVEKLKDLNELSKNLIRTNAIEDSIELKEKLNSLQLHSNNLTKSGQSRLNELEHALAIAESFYESYRMLEVWFDEIKAELGHVEAQHAKESLTSEPKEAIKLELTLLKQLDRSLQEKKSDLETMNKNGFALARLCNKNNGFLALPTYTQPADQLKNCQSAQQLKESIQYSNERYDNFKTLVVRRKEELEALLWKSAEFTEKLDNLTCALNAILETCEYAEPISGHPDKLRLQIEDTKVIQGDLDKRKQALDDLRDQAINDAVENRNLFGKNSDMLTSMTSISSNDQQICDENIEKRINDLDELWYQLKELAECRTNALEEALGCAETFWSDFHSFMDMIGDLEDRLKQIENETVAMDPDSVIEQQQHQEEIVREIDENESSIADFRESGVRLMELCGQGDVAEVEKTVEELDVAWTRIKQLVRDREVELQHTFGKACEFQQELIEILEWISLQQEKFINLDSSFTSNDSKTIRFQINLLKEFKDQIDPEQLKIQLLNQKFNDLKMNTKTNQSFDVLASLQEPLNSANKEWKRLQNGIVERKANLQNALLDMGQFNEALDEMLKWLERTDQSLDEINQTNSSENELITSNQLVSGIDIQLAKLKVLKNDITAQEQSVEKLKETGKNLIKNETTGKQTLQEIKHRVQLLIDNWESLLLKLQEKQATLNSRLIESNSFQCELQDALVWLAEIETHLHNTKPTGGLPETAREQLDKFIPIYEQIEANEEIIGGLIATGQSLIDKNKLCQKQQVSTSQSLNQSIDTLSSRWSHAKTKATQRREKLETALKDANEFHTSLQDFIGWLTETEKNLNINRAVSKLLDVINEQIGEHQLLQKNITEHRAQMVALDTLGYQLKYFSQKQDVILIKNVLISVQNRWEKIVSRSAERTRDLERGYKESKRFTDNWTELIQWLNTNLDNLEQEQAIIVGNNPTKIRQLIIKHKEFHRLLSQHQASYDSVMKHGRKIIDKCDAETGRTQLQEMLNEAKNKWQTICFQSAERQKRLEDALLCSGQFRDALQSLLEWLSRVEPTLAENNLLNGDLESVLALIEDNQQFQQQLQYKADQVQVVRKAAGEMIMASNMTDSDSDSLRDQLEEMNELWGKVDDLSRDRTQRLDVALKMAKEFNARVRSRLEWLSSAEQVLKYSSTVSTESEPEIIEQIEQHQNFVRDFRDQEVLIKQCLTLGHELLNTCTPESIVNLKHSIAVVQSRFDEINMLSEQKCKRLSDALEQCKENETLLAELLIWVQGAEATLTASEQVKIVSNLEQIEQLLQDHQDFQGEMQTRQLMVERLTKNSLVRDMSESGYSYQQNEMKKKSTSVRSLNKVPVNSGWRTPEPKMKNPRVSSLFNRWRRVWLMSLDRQRKLKEALDRQRELERLKNFSFDDWRRRYMNWHKDNRARITDFFRRQDRDHDGKISREEFIEGILSSNFPSSRLELEAVADKFDLDKDGFIDYKEFLATLKPASNTEPNFERIRDEVQRQVSLCKCSKRYHVLQISDRQYRFGDSQKLRLVRILQSTVMVRVGGGWMALDEFLVKNDPCRAKGRTNMDLQLQNNLLLKEITAQQHSMYRPKSPARFSTSMNSPAATNHQTNKANSRSGASSSSANYSGSKRTPRSSLSQSNELLILGASMPSEANSNSESLGASISDLSSEAASEFSDIYSLNPSNINSLNSKSITTSKSGTSTPTKNGSRLPVLKKAAK